MNPDWIKEAYARQNCPECGVAPFVRDTRKVVASNAEPGMLNLKPNLVITCAVQCHQCMAFTNYRFIRPSIDLYLFLTCQFTIPAFELKLIPFFRIQSDEQLDKRMPRQFKSPINDREVRVFLNLLHRTSFRRDSKSYGKWLKRFTGDQDN